MFYSINLAIIDNWLETLLVMYLPLFLIIFSLIKYKDVVREKKNLFRFIYLGVILFSALVIRLPLYGFRAFEEPGGNPLFYFIFPQYFCDISFIAVVIALITENKKVMTFAATAGIVAVMPFVLPTFNYGTWGDSLSSAAMNLAYLLDHFVYFTYSIFIIIAYKYKPTIEDFKFVAVITIVLSYFYALPLASIGIDHYIFNKDYFFFRTKEPLGADHVMEKSLYASIFTALMIGGMFGGNRLHRHISNKINTED